MSLVKHKRGTQAAYNSATKAENVIYFVTDTKRIYQNGVCFAGNNQWGGGDSNYCSLTIDGTAKNVVLDTDQVFRNRGDIAVARVDLTDTTANATGYSKVKSGVYNVRRSGYSELFISFTLASGSTSSLELKTSYEDASYLYFRKTIDNNRVSGPWRAILTDSNYQNFTYSKTDADSRFVNTTGDVMTGALKIVGSYANPTWDSAARIEFAETTGSGQAVTLVYTSYDSYRAPAGIILSGRDPDCWFEVKGNTYSKGFCKTGSNDNYLLLGGGGHVHKDDVGMSRTVSIEVGGDKNTWYPVRITLSNVNSKLQRVIVWKNLGSKTPAGISGNHSGGTSSLFAMYEGRFTGWDGNCGYLVTRHCIQDYATLVAHVHPENTDNGHLWIWLRGGGCQYNISANYEFTTTTYLSGFTNNTNPQNVINFQPKTSLDGCNYGVFNHTNIIKYVVDKAVRLDTARTITLSGAVSGSTTFDGSGNVTIATSVSNNVDDWEKIS